MAGVAGLAAGCIWCTVLSVLLSCRLAVLLSCCLSVVVCAECGVWQKGCCLLLNVGEVTGGACEVHIWESAEPTGFITVTGASWRSWVSIPVPLAC